ncbi:MAG: GNAT family N-acetyltransferase [Burkholderiaceae bacterium]|nr:GNAT family N-acetyltransferase [Burkholderiaceae bacterium]
MSFSRFSWRGYYVACAPDGTVQSGMGVRDHRDITRGIFHMNWMVPYFFGPFKAPGILSRGAVLGSAVPPPERGQTLLTNIATDERVRGTGAFTALLTHALVSGWLRCAPDDQYLLDVLLNNRARHLYERLGFVAQPQQHPPSARLPADLVAVRMVWSAQGIAALRTQARPVQEAHTRLPHAR